MAKIARATQKQFAGSASVNQIAKFGSLAASSPVRYSGSTATAANVQALTNFLNGWFDAVIGGASPNIEDMNALFWLCFYQLGYILQTGVPEWDAGTTYYQGSLVTDTGGLGQIYRSLTNTNLNNALTDTTNWTILTAPTAVTNITGDGTNRTLTAADNGTVFEFDNISNFKTITLPGTIPNFRFTIVDGTGFFNQNPVTIVRTAAEKIQNFSGNMILKTQFGRFTFECNAAGNWNIVS